MNRILTLTFAALLAAGVPTGMAGWAADGDFEPNTAFDTPAFMFQEPATSGKQVYFNAFSTIQVIGPNPNVATLETRNQVFPYETPGATLGVWVDCNNDGYIGFAEAAVREYPSELLDLSGADPTICPASTGPQNFWNGAHNYNGWVSELIPIGNDQANQANNKRQYVDPTAMVWIDYGRPDDITLGAAGGNCPINPQPRGTFQSTGGFLNFVNCGDDYLTTFNTVVDAAGDPAGLRFQDTGDAHSGPLGQFETFGSEDSSYAAVYVVDCDAEEPMFRVGDVFSVNDTLNDAGLNVLPELGPAVDEISVAALAPGVGDPTTMTVPGQVNQTNAETGDCDPENDEEGPFYGQLEGDVAATKAVGKQSAADNFDYFSRGRGVVNPAKPLWNGAAGADDGFGIGRARADISLAAEWMATNLITLVPNTVTTRGSVTGGDVEPVVDEPRWLTYYAFVGSNVTDKGIVLPGGTGVYGQAQCGGADSGIVNGWDCDASQWNLNADGTPIDTTAHGLAAVGQVYNLRDVDCLDGGNNLGVGLGAPFYGESNCS